MKGLKIMQMESMDSKRNKSKVIIRYYYDRVSRDVGNFLKWIALAVLTGLVVGGASSIFAGCIKWVTEYRNNNIWCGNSIYVSDNRSS